MSRVEPNRVVRSLPDTIPFVAPEELERQLGFKFKARLGANESVFGPSPKAIQAMQEQVRQSQNYGDPLSYPLRECLDNKYGGGIENYLVGPGIDGLLGHFAAAYLDSDSTVVTTLGSYPTFDYAVSSVGAKIERVPYRDFKVDLEALAEKVREANAKVVYVANPDNPSGSFHSKEAIEAFLKSLPDTTMFLLDEAYIDFVEDFPLDDPRLIRLRTFSKAHGMAGMRVGYARGHSNLLAPLNKVRAHFEVSSVAQAGALASLKDEDFLESVISRNRIKRDQLSVLLSNSGLNPLDSNTNFILANAATKSRAEEIIMLLRQEKVFIRKPALLPFESFIRVSVGLESDLEVLEQALTKIL